MAEHSSAIPQNDGSKNLDRGFETRPVNIRGVLIVAGVLLVVAVVIHFVMSCRRCKVVTENTSVIAQNDLEFNREIAHIPAESLNRGFEARPLNIRSVVIFTVTLLATIGVIFLVLWWTLSTWKAQTLVPQVQIPPVNATVQPAPGAFPVVDAPVNLQAVVDPALANLNSYGWVDQKAGVVRIPIARAMTLLLQHGLPARNAKAPSFGLDDAHQMEGRGGQAPDNAFVMR